MSDLKVILFEDPLPLQMVLGLIAIIGIVLWVRRRTRIAIPLTVCSLALIGVLAITAASVTTETERLAQTLDALVVAVRDGDMAAMADLIDESYGDGRYSKADIVAEVEQARRTIGLTDLDISSVEMNVTGSDALVAFRATVRVSSPMAMRDTWPTRWRLWLKRRPQGWRVTSSRLDEPGGTPRAPMGP